MKNKKRGPSQHSLPHELKRRSRSDLNSSVTKRADFTGSSDLISKEKHKV